MRGPKKRGRPRLDDDDPTVGVNVSMPSKQYDHLSKRAMRQDVSVPEIIRRDLARILDDDDE